MKNALKEDHVHSHQTKLPRDVSGKGSETNIQFSDPASGYVSWYMQWAYDSSEHSCNKSQCCAH